MKVHELRTILDHLDPDMPVFVTAPRGLHHVCTVERRAAGRLSGWDLPGRVVLDGYPTLWFEDEPEFGLRGAFQRKRDLLAALDPDVPAGDAA